MKHFLKVGDRVCINNNGYCFNKAQNAMQPYVGKVFTIASINTSGQIHFVESSVVVKPSMRSLGEWNWFADGVDKVNSIPEGFKELMAGTSHVSVKAIRNGDIIVVDGEVYAKIPVKKMTLKEIEATLGHKVEIVKGKTK